MSDLQEFVSDLLERNGAVVEAADAHQLAVLSPPPVQKSLSLPEFARLGFGTPGVGAERSDDTVHVGLEGDWMERLATLLHDKGRWSQRELVVANELPTPGDPQRVLDRALDLPNAVCRFLSIAQTHARCLVLTFRYTAVSDEKREGLFWLGFNTDTGAVINDLLAQLRPLLAQTSALRPPAEATMLATGAGWNTAAIESRARPLIDRQVREEIEPFVRAMQRRLARDRDRVHAYHNGLHQASSRRLAALSQAKGERAEADRRRETMRIEAIAQEYRAKLDDLRHNYALRVAVEWVQALELYLPVQRIDVLIRRRKGERVIQLDWHPLLKAAEAPLCEAGDGRDRVRLVCDEKLHLTEPSAQGPCVACGKPFCRACFPAACPRCRSAVPSCTVIDDIAPRKVAL
jgi:hypothetical protein